MTQGVPTAQSQALLFGRSCEVTVGSVLISNIGTQVGLDIWFNVKRTLKANTPATCDLKIWNLSDATRATIESYTQVGVSPATAPGTKTGGLSTIVPVKVVAGYVGNMSTIFLGELRSAQTVQDGPDFITELTSGDGDEATILARSSASFGTGANAYVVAKRCMTDMKVGDGNIATVKSILTGAPLFAGGYVLKGRSMSHLADIARSCGLEVSIQDGVTQWTTAGQPLGGQAYLLSSSTAVPAAPLQVAAGTNTGLIGSPTVDTKGLLHAETLLLPGIVPGQPIVMQARFVNGAFRVTECEYKGDTHGNEWSIAIQAARFGVAA
jgi:hypothetical protein